jgi:N-acetylneuraminate synthase
MNIAGRPIGRDAQPFVIAEMSGNHNRSLDQALAIVDAAAKAGAHAVKLQTYTADTITLDCRSEKFFIKDARSPWHGERLYDLYLKAHTPWDWHPPIMQRAHDQGLICFSSVFDETSVDFLESLSTPAYKIASFENTHHPRIRKAAATGKPLIMSTGMASIAELDEAVAVARAAGCKDLVLLKCTSSYPASPSHSNIRTIRHMQEMFACEVGLSDHTLGVGVAAAAVACGATVFEKHLTLCRADGGVDSAFSMEPHEFASLVTETTNAWEALGNVHYGATQAEVGSLAFRRSLFIATDLPAGERLTESAIRVVRPAHGLHPRHLPQFLGRELRRNVAKGEPLDWGMI